MADRGAESILQSQALLVGAQFSRLGLGLLVTVLLVRGLDDAGWAAFMLLSTACAFAALLIDAGLQPALVTELAAGGPETPALLRRVLAIRWALALVVLVVVLGLPRLLPDLLPRVVFFVVVLTLPLRSWNALFAATRRNRVTALGGLVIHAVFVVAVLTSLRLAPRDLAASILVLLCAREIALSLYPWLRARRAVRPPAGEIERGSGPRGLVLLSAATICGAAYLHLDVFMLETLRGPEDVGRYGIATRLLLPVMVGANLLAAPFLPFLARRHDEAALPSLSDGLVLAALILGAVLPAAVCFESAAALIDLVKGEAAPVAASALSTLKLVPAAVAFGSAFSLALVIGRRYGLWLLVTALGLVANVALNLLWIPAEGPVGAARATLVTEFLVAVLAGLVLVLAPRSRPRWPLGQVGRALGLALAPAALVLALRLLLGPIAGPAPLLVLVVAALAASGLWMLLGPARKIRARIESEGAQEEPA